MNLGPCDEWTGRFNDAGYGVIDLGYGQNNRPYRAHRIIYIQDHGDIGDLVVRHLCHNRACVNISHLAEGTHADNTNDMVKAGRFNNQRRTHCREGHPYSKENTYNTSTITDGAQVCKICQRASRLRWYYKNKLKV